MIHLTLDEEVFSYLQGVLDEESLRLALDKKHLARLARHSATSEHKDFFWKQYDASDRAATLNALAMAALGGAPCSV